MGYRYKMIQVPPTVAVKSRGERGSEAAAYLAKVVNEQAKLGWDFFRVDSLGVQTQAGCLGAFAGAQASTSIYYVITFRQSLQPDLAPSEVVE